MMGAGNEEKLVDARIAAFKNISKYFSAVAAKKSQQRPSSVAPFSKLIN